MKKKILLFSMLLPFCILSQTLTSITPNSAIQGQTVPSLIISGNNMSFSGWSCWSNAGNLSDFRFSQWSGTNMLYGAPTSATATQLNGNLSVPSFQSIGIYNLEVFDCGTASWIILPFSFQINSSSTSIFLENIEKLTIYPNPTKDIINIKFKNLIVQDIKINIINSIGELVFSENLLNHIGGYNKKIDLKENSKGIYLLEIETGGGVIKKKLILQ